MFFTLFFRYYKKSKNTCEKFASKKARNCKKKDEVGVKGKHARVLGVRAAVGPDARAQVPLDVRRVRRLRGLRELVLQKNQEHVRGLRVQEEQELQEEGRVGHEGEESLSDDLRRVLMLVTLASGASRPGPARPSPTAGRPRPRAPWANISRRPKMVRSTFARCFAHL